MCADEASPTPATRLPLAPVRLELLGESSALATGVAIVTKAGSSSSDGFAKHVHDFAMKAGDFAA
jgi:hypothetical protein